MLQLTKVRVPADGSCFFHAIGLQVQTNAKEIRRICELSVRKRAQQVFNGLTLETWIRYEKGLDVEAYAQAIGEHLWGGLVELKLLADYFQRPFVVYTEQTARMAQKIMVVEPSDKNMMVEPVYLLFRGQHYDALVPRCGNKDHGRGRSA